MAAHSRPTPNVVRVLQLKLPCFDLTSRFKSISRADVGAGESEKDKKEAYHPPSLSEVKLSPSSLVSQT